MFPSLGITYIFPPMASIYMLPSSGIDCIFPALDIRFLVSRAFHRFTTFPRLAAVTGFPALGSGYMFSRACDWLHISRALRWLRPVYTGDFCRGNSVQFLLRQSRNFKIACVNQARFSVRFVAAISQGFRACLKLVATYRATKIASSCRDKNRLCKRAFRHFPRLASVAFSFTGITLRP